MVLIEWNKWIDNWSLAEFLILLRISQKLLPVALQRFKYKLAGLLDKLSDFQPRHLQEYEIMFYSRWVTRHASFKVRIVPQAQIIFWICIQFEDPVNVGRCHSYNIKKCTKKSEVWSKRTALCASILINEWRLQWWKIIITDFSNANFLTDLPDIQWLKEYDLQ